MEKTGKVGNIVENWEQQEENLYKMYSYMFWFA